MKIVQKAMFLFKLPNEICRVSHSLHKTSNPDAGNVWYARILGAGPQLDQRRRRKGPTNPLLPLRPGCITTSSGIKSLMWGGIDPLGLSIPTVIHMGQQGRHIVPALPDIT